MIWKWKVKGLKHTNQLWRALNRWEKNYDHGWDQNCIVKSLYFIEISWIQGEIKITGPENIIYLKVDLILLLCYCLYVSSLTLILCRRTKFSATRTTPSFTFVFSNNYTFEVKFENIKEVSKICFDSPFELTRSLNLASGIRQTSVSLQANKWFWMQLDQQSFSLQVTVIVKVVVVFC